MFNQDFDLRLITPPLEAYQDTDELIERVAPNKAFVTLHFPNDPMLKQVQDQVISKMGSEADIKASDPANFHITLLYLMDVSDDDLQTLIRRFDPRGAFTVDLIDIDVFYNDESPLIIRVQPTERLLELQSELAALAGAMGLETSNYSNATQYLPHLTLGYIGNPDYLEMIPRYGRGRIGSVHVDAVTFWRDGYKLVAQKEAK